MGTKSQDKNSALRWVYFVLCWATRTFGVNAPRKHVTCIVVVTPLKLLSKPPEARLSAVSRFTSGINTCACMHECMLRGIQCRTIIPVLTLGRPRSTVWKELGCVAITQPNGDYNTNYAYIPFLQQSRQSVAKLVMRTKFQSLACFFGQLIVESAFYPLNLILTSGQQTMQHFKT